VATGQLGEGLRVRATLSPRATGTNTVTLQLQDLEGAPVEPPRSPTVRVRSDAVDLGDVAITSRGVGTYRADVVLPTPGTWRVQVSLRLDEFENPVASLSFRVPADGG
jgi:copper transport protein